jgi:hypothetical protein
MWKPNATAVMTCKCFIFGVEFELLRIMTSPRQSVPALLQALSMTAVLSPLDPARHQQEQHSPTAASIAWCHISWKMHASQPTTRSCLEQRLRTRLPRLIDSCSQVTCYVSPLRPQHEPSSGFGWRLAANISWIKFADCWKEVVLQCGSWAEP